MTEYRTLSQKFSDAVSSLSNLENSPLRNDSSEFRDLAKEVELQLTDLKTSIQKLSLFSSNEDLEELQTKELRYLNIDCYLARFYENSGSLNLKDRQNKLKLSKNLFLQFLHNLENYNILNKDQRKKLDNFGNSFNPTLSELRPDEPVRRREEKIANHKFEQQLQDKLKILSDPKTNVDNLDDEVVREIYIDQLRLNSVKAFQSLESITMELELLQNFPKEPKIQEIQNDDKREAAPPSLSNDYLYTEKLETLTTPLLSKTGKILRPFTIIPNRNAIRGKVFGTGQELPSMSVEEFLEYELENGGMVSKQEEEKELDEDNLDEVDLETYKQREWDEFKEANVKGSGNTINRG